MISSFLLIIFVTGLYGVVHSLLAAKKVKQFAADMLGQSRYRWYRLAYNIFAFISLLPVLALAIILPDGPIFSIPFPWDIPLILLQLAGAAFSFFASLETGLGTLAGLTQLTKGAEDNGAGHLVTGGLYRYVRHPIYTGAVIFLWATPELTWNGLALRLAFTLYFIFGGMVEEKKLVEEYGDEYRSYRMKTPMIIPGLKKST